MTVVMIEPDVLYLSVPKGMVMTDSASWRTHDVRLVPAITGLPVAELQALRLCDWPACKCETGCAP